MANSYSKMASTCVLYACGNVAYRVDMKSMKGSKKETELSVEKLDVIQTSFEKGITIS